MPKTKFILLFLISTLSLVSMDLYAQSKPSDINFIDKKGRKQGYWKKIDTTGVSYEGQFKDDMPYGRFTYYDKNGQIVSISDFFREGYASETSFFFPDGTIRAKGFYLDKMRDSVWQIYNPKGQLLKEERYENGLLTGLSRTFDKDTNVIEIQYWLRGLRNGLWWEKTDKGTQTTHYKLNKSHGEYFAYYPTDTLSIYGNYIEGFKEGPWSFFYDDGLLEKIMYYKNNLLIKKEIALHVDDQVIMISTDTVAFLYTNGKISVVKCTGGKEYRTRQDFKKLTKAFDTDFFFLADPNFMAAFTMYESMSLIPKEDLEDIERIQMVAEGEEIKEPQRAVLHLKIPTPFEVIINEEVITLLNSMRSIKEVGE